MGWTRSRWRGAAMLAIAFCFGGLLTADAAEPARSVWVPVEPARVLDTRIDVGLAGPLATGVARSLKVTGVVPVVLPGDQPNSALVVPEGATGVIANVTAVYTIALRRYRTDHDGTWPITLKSANNATENVSLATTAQDLTPQVTEIVDADETFAVEFDDGVSGSGTFGNGLCDVAVTYRLPANGAP